MVRLFSVVNYLGAAERASVWQSVHLVYPSEMESIIGAPCRFHRVCVIYRRVKYCHGVLIYNLTLWTYKADGGLSHDGGVEIIEHLIPPVSMIKLPIDEMSNVNRLYTVVRLDIILVVVLINHAVVD